jgi:hypothetical protein
MSSARLINYRSGSNRNQLQLTSPSSESCIAFSRNKYLVELIILIKRGTRLRALQFSSSSSSSSFYLELLITFYFSNHNIFNTQLASHHLGVTKQSLAKRETTVIVYVHLTIGHACTSQSFVLWIIYIYLIMTA